ncbi:MAG: glycosyltransferase family 2 protein [Paludibacteraceae bacterium]|nr:glycosyltransferase family 2 protein [Candidatus Physcocola equi]MCQ2235187.1 glycosyltransferase family 2 protein [Paludibacteraceae bacterium]
MKTAVVILNWNGRKFLEQFLPSVVRDSLIPDAEVIVADNGSTDDSIAFLQQSYPQVRVLAFDENYGFAEGYNRALAAIDAEYVVLLNSDIETTPGWLDSLVSFMDENPDVAGCQPKIRAFYNKDFFEHAGAAGGFIDKWGYPFCRGRLFANVERDNAQYDTVTDVFWTTGAALMVRRKLYLENGGLDVSFFAHQEEIDLCWRLRARGYRLACVPHSMVYHVGGGTLSAANPRKTFLNFRNNLFLIYKNEPKACKVLFVRFFMDYLAAFVFLAKLDFANFAAVLNARFQFWKMRSSFAAKRQENMKKTVNDNIPEVYPHSLVWQCYLNGLKSFKEWRN